MSTTPANPDDVTKEVTGADYTAGGPSDPSTPVKEISPEEVEAGLKLGLERMKSERADQVAVRDHATVEIKRLDEAIAKSERFLKATQPRTYPNRKPRAAKK